MLAAIACCLILAPRLAAAAEEVVNVKCDGAAGVVLLDVAPKGGHT